MNDVENSHKANWPALPNHHFDETDPRENIDFPVSDDWLRHYSTLGLTERRPEPNVQAQLNEMSSRLERLETSIGRAGKEKIQPVYLPTPRTSSSKKYSKY